MAPEERSKKRKAAVPADEVARVKKVKQLAIDVSTDKRKGSSDAASIGSKKTKASKPDPIKPAGLKATKKVTTKEGVATTADLISLSPKPKSSKDVLKAEKGLKVLKKGIDVKGDTTNKSTITPSEREEKLVPDDEDGDHSEDSEDEEVDDQTEALLRGFESDDDEQEDAEATGYNAGEPIPDIGKKLKKKAKKAAETSASNEPGVIYLGRIPHGFYEHEMRQYFGQFGDILRCRLSRNRKTGKSKHFAFLEFKSSEVAEIVAKTMDNYLLFGHILKCKTVKKEQVHESMWKGANRRFKKVPWNRIEGRKLEQGMTEEGWDKRVEKEEKRRAEKAKKMMQLGYEFESPKLKSAKEVPKKQPAILATAKSSLDIDETSKAIEASKNSEPKDSASAADNTLQLESAKDAAIVERGEKGKAKKPRKSTQKATSTAGADQPGPVDKESQQKVEEIGAVQVDSEVKVQNLELTKKSKKDKKNKQLVT